MVERQTEVFPFIEDLDIQAYAHWDWLGGIDYTKKSAFTMPPDYLIVLPPEISETPGRFLEERALCVHALYPDKKKLRVLVYQASGYNKGKKLLKSSYHLVWRDILVDKKSAPKIREETLERFVKKSGSTGKKDYWYQFRSLLKVAHLSNNYDMVFDKTTVTDKNGLRMPYNDKAKCDRMKIPGVTGARQKITGVTIEERPQLPVGELEFEFYTPNGESEARVRARWIKDKSGYTVEQWIRNSSCRSLELDITRRKDVYTPSH